MKSPKDIKIKDYTYPLTDERIAKFPLEKRDQSKLLVYDQGQIGERHFADLPELLPEGSLVVMNNTRVIQARLFFYKETGARVEILVLEPALPREYQENFAQRGRTAWQCMVGGLKKWKQGPLRALVNIEGEEVEVKAEKEESLALTFDTAGRQGSGPEGALFITFTWDPRWTWSEILEAMGELPIPPYLNRRTEESDKRTYQTVYSKIEGSVAAPTAGLHFTPEVLQNLTRKGIEREEVTLHVGAGTFRPVKSQDIGHHDMHTEHFAVRRQTLEALIRHQGHATAIGTTSVRTLESLYWMGRKLHAMVLQQGNKQQQEHPQSPNGGDEMPCFHVSQWEPYETNKDLDYRTEEREGEECTTLNALQALADYMDAHHMDSLHATTQIIIVPGYRYRIVNRIVTNFHQPQSTLLLLVAAFVGEDWHKIYDYALANNFRFLSYGDSSLLLPKSGTKSSES